MAVSQRDPPWSHPFPDPSPNTAHACPSQHPQTEILQGSPGVRTDHHKVLIPLYMAVVTATIFATVALTTFRYHIAIIDNSLGVPVVVRTAPSDRKALNLIRVLPALFTALYMIFLTFLMALIWKRNAIVVATIVCFFLNCALQPLGMFVISPYTNIFAMMAAIREVTLVVVATTEQESSCTSRKQEYPPHTMLSVVLEPMESSGVYSSFGSSEAKTSENGHQLRMIHEEKNLSDGGLSSSRSSSLSGKSLRQQQQQLHVNFDDQ